MLEKVNRYIDKWQMLTSEDCVIVGVSGGADSICLLLVLLEIQKKQGFRMVAVHVNHGLRGEAANADEEFVKDFCEKHEVPLEIYFADVESIAKKRKQSTEEAGRDIRREFFKQTLQKYKGTKIALAHHQNDNVETVLFRLSRGTGLKGLCGISPVKGVFIRPLLCTNRKEIEAFLTENGVSYCVDETNASDVYARNLIRNQIIPRMEEGINSKTVEHMNRTIEHMSQIQDYLEQQATEYLERCVEQTREGMLIIQGTYDTVPDVLKPILIKKILVLVSGNEKDLEEVHVIQVMELFEKQTGRKSDLPYFMEAKRVYEGVKVCRKKQNTDTCDEEIFMDLETNEAKYTCNGFNIECRIRKKEEIIDKSCEKIHTKLFNCDIIKNGICFRTRRSGDYITIHPDGRTQKLKTYFINEKIPAEERDNILLVADGSHVLWVVGYRVSSAYQVKETTKSILEIRVDKGEKNGRDN